VASLSTPRAAPSMGLTRAPVASAHPMNRSVSRGSGVAGLAGGMVLVESLGHRGQQAPIIEARKHPGV
jgi:hypothetical protein